MLNNIYLIAGHNTKGVVDPGACANGYQEAQLTVELRDLVYNELKKSNFKGNIYKDDDTKSLGGSTGIFSWLNAKPLTQDDLVLEFHFNAATPLAQGVEAIVPDYNGTKIDIREVRIAVASVDIVSNVLGIPIRKHPLGKGIMLPKETHRKSIAMMKLKGINVLLEVCFITNIAEITKYQERKGLLSKRLASMLLNE